MQNIFIEVLPPWVETGLQPAFYDLESGTVLQQTARMYAKVRELNEAFNTFSTNVTNEINQFEQDTNDEIERFENATNDEIERFEGATNDEIERFEGVVNDTVEEYIGKFNELHDYVEDYFENLDVQEEINNKLDDMVEQGTLQEIITTYIQSNVAWTFDSVSEMQSSTNLIAGSYAQTFGYASVDDGGASLYLIRNKEEGESADNMFTIAIGSTLIAELVTVPNINICQLGASTSAVDNSTFINASLTKLNYACIPEGEFTCASTIELSESQTLYGLDHIKSVLVYSGNQKLIQGVDDPTTRYITIKDLTLRGTNRTGYGIYIHRTTKDGDAWHRISSVSIRNFEYGMYLSKAVNETALNDIVCNSNSYGIWYDQVDDFYMSNITTAVNTKDGVHFQSCSEGRIFNLKSWYNGSTGNTYFNLSLISCTALMMANIGCQESYFSNLNLLYCRDVNITNCYLSKPNVDDSEAAYQLISDGNNSVTIEAKCANTKVSGNYFNKVMWLKNPHYNCSFTIGVEDDYPKDKVEQIADSVKGKGFEVNNSIVLNKKDFRYNTNLNYLINGDLSYQTDLSMLSGGDDICSWTGGLLRAANATGAAKSVKFKTSVIPTLSCYTMYLRFKKVSGNGRITMNYTCYADIGADDPVGTEYCISQMQIPANLNATTNNFISIPNGVTIDIEEVGFVLGRTGTLLTPLSPKAKLS